MRPSTAQQRFACQLINMHTGLSLPTGWEDDFYICHAYIGMYYDHAKYIRDTHPIQRADWQEPPVPQPYNPERYVELHEAIDSPTADPLRRPIDASQLRQRTRPAHTVIQQALDPTANPLEPRAATIRRWVNPGFGPPQLIDELVSEPEPDDTPSEETLKDLIARQFTTTKEE